MKSIQEFSQSCTPNCSTARSSLFIAHRLATIQDVDSIIVLDKGNVIESGKHDELISKSGLYFRMWESQQKKF